jgi:hypothetical protein
LQNFTDLRRINELINHFAKTTTTTGQELPNLVQLQRNLQSPFFHTVRGVYEYVYQQQKEAADETAATLSPEV